jgi:Domain of unknown function (DUF305)
MIPHHEGAVEMAKVLLRHGNDADSCKLAEDMIRSQTTDIAMMLGSLRCNGIERRFCRLKDFQRVKKRCDCNAVSVLTATVGYWF